MDAAFSTHEKNEKYKCRRGNNIAMYTKDIWCEDLDLIHLAQDKGQCGALILSLNGSERSGIKRLEFLD